MNVRLKKQRDGGWRKHWYGIYDDNGKQTEINLNVPWDGIPPASGSFRDTGDEDFENSRVMAEQELKGHLVEVRHKGRAEHLTERLIESKTGKTVEYARIDALPDRWRDMGRNGKPCVRYLKACDAHFRRFIKFMKERKASVAHLYEVAPADAAAYVSKIQSELAPKTVKDAVKLLNKSFVRFLPIGAANPFADFIGRRQNGESEAIHRKPFTPEELRLLFDAGSNDEFMFPLIVTAACTGMRRGDVCGLKWKDVDLSGGMLTVKTSKTGANVEIPIFHPLRTVLEARKGKRGIFVYPEAEKMLRDHPDSLTRRFKEIVARAFAPASLPASVMDNQSPEVLEAEGTAAITKALPEGKRRDRIIDTFRRYVAGSSIRQIVKDAKLCKATVSNDLHAAQDLIGKPFLRVQTLSMTKAIRDTTQVKREQGKRMASIRDWHTMRATWVTLALTAGVPVELVRRVTGHATVEVVLKHYFRPDREQFRTVLTGALPDILTGEKTIIANSNDELAALVAKLNAKSATEDDKARLRLLVSRV